MGSKKTGKFSIGGGSGQKKTNPFLNGIITNDPKVVHWQKRSRKNRKIPMYATLMIHCSRTDFKKIKWTPPYQSINLQDLGDIQKRLGLFTFATHCAPLSIKLLVLLG